MEICLVKGDEHAGISPSQAFTQSSANTKPSKDTSCYQHMNPSKIYAPMKSFSESYQTKAFRYAKRPCVRAQGFEMD